MTGVCDYATGQCPCHVNVAIATEQNVLDIANDLQCRSCLVNYFGHMTGQGCEPCGCDVIGTNATQCNDTGDCVCKATIGGEKCDVCLPGYYLFTTDGCSVCNCSEAGSLTIECDAVSGQCACRQNVNGLQCDSCVDGSFNLQTLNPDGCQKCFCYGHGTTCTSAPGFGSSTVTASATQIGGWDMADPFIIGSSASTHYMLSSDFLGNKLSSYGTNITAVVRTRGGASVDYSAKNTVVMEGNEMRIFYNANTAMIATSVDSQLNISLRESFWTYNSTAAPDNYQFYQILSDLTAIYVQRVFRPDIVVDFSNVAMETTKAVTPGGKEVNSVEDCTCLANAFVDGLSCEDCAQGYRRPTVNGSSYETCIACDCGVGKTLTNPPECDQDTGECLNCKNGTTGSQCEACAAFVDNCDACTDTKCGTCADTYWGLDMDGCTACDCDLTGAVDPVCEKVTGQCDCQPNVGELQCNQCVDNYFNLQADGCSECNECYSLVKKDVDMLREIRDNMTQFVTDLQSNDVTGDVGPFGPRLRETRTNMQWLLLYLSEAEAVQTDTLAEAQRLNSTLNNLYQAIATTDIDLGMAMDNITIADNYAEQGQNVTSDTQFIMIEANAVLNANTANSTRSIEELLASIQTVQQAMLGVPNEDIGDVLKVVNDIKAGSTQAKLTADEAYLTAQGAENMHRQTTSETATLEQFVLGVNGLRDDTTTAAAHALGNASASLDIANTALNNATDMLPIPTDVPGLVNRATLLKSESETLKTQSDNAVTASADVINTVNEDTSRTSLLLDDVNIVSSTSSRLQLRLDSAANQVTSARLVSNRSFVDANRMLDIMKDFTDQVSAVSTQANAALEKVQAIQILAEQSIAEGRTLQEELQVPVERAQTALETASNAAGVGLDNIAKYNASYDSAQALSDYSKSVLNDVNIYPEIAKNTNDSIVAPSDQMCQNYAQQTAQLQETASTVVIAANNASSRVTETSTKINAISQSFQDVQDIDQTNLATLRTRLQTTKDSFNKQLLTDTVNKLKSEMEQNRVELQGMKARKEQLRIHIQRLRNIQEQLGRT